jgi:FlaA1/EpsC-like NDP-sugar epimerase
LRGDTSAEAGGGMGKGVKGLERAIRDSVPQCAVRGLGQQGDRLLMRGLSDAVGSAHGTFIRLTGVRRNARGRVVQIGQRFGSEGANKVPHILSDIVHADATEGLPDFAATYAGQSVMITGAGGTIGLELCRQIIAAGPRKLVLFEISEHALYVALRTVESLVAVHSAEPRFEVIPVLGSVADAPHVTETLNRYGIEVVLHAAAYKHVHLVEANPRAGLINNTLGTATLAHAARDCGVGRFVLVSTDKAVRPAGVMGASKRLAEMAVQDLASRPGPTVFSVVRFGNVIGSSGSVIPLFREQINAGGPVTLTHPGATRYFMTLEDAARLVLAAGFMAEGGEIFLLDMGLPVPIRDIARQMIAASGRTVRDAANPAGDIAVVTTGLRPGEKLHEELTTGRTTEATRHPRIFRLSETCLSEIEMAAALRDLRNAVERGRDADLREMLRRWLPASAAEQSCIGAPRRVRISCRADDIVTPRRGRSTQ